MPIWAMLAILIVIAALYVAAAVVTRRARDQHLNAHFGHNYGRLFFPDLLEDAPEESEPEYGGAGASRSLPAHERERFVYAWRAHQTRFVDDPRGAINGADRLVTDVMRANGYLGPHAADVPGHPDVIQNYRVGREIVERYQRGEAGIEELQGAMVCYRAIVNDLLGLQEPRRHHV